MNARPSVASTTKKTAAPMIDPAGGVAINRMPGLTALMAQAAASLGGRLEALLGDAPRATMEGMSATTLAKALAENQDSLGATILCQTLEARLLLAFDPRTADLLAAAVFGEADSRAAAARQPSAIERRLAEAFARAVAQVFESVFLESSARTFELEKLLTISDIGGMGWRDMPAIAARFSVATAAGSCAFQLLVPQTVLHALHEKLAHEEPQRLAPRDPQWSQQISAGVSKAPVAVTAILEQFDMTLGEIAAFGVGRLIELRGDTRGRVRLECAGQGVFWGKLHQSDAGYRIEVENPIDEEDEFVALLPG
jgi:flagellar motor switch protein FliM